MALMFEDVSAQRCCLATLMYTGVLLQTYHETLGIAGLNYLALGVGLTTAAQLNGRFMDKIYVYYKNKNGGIAKPEFRLREYFHSFLLMYPETNPRHLTPTSDDGPRDNPPSNWPPSHGMDGRK